MNRKGQLEIFELFALLIGGIITVSLTYLPPSDILKIKPTIDAKEIEINANILANFLMSDKDLMPINSNHLGTLNSVELDKRMTGTSTTYDNLLSCPPADGALCKQTFYPDSFSLILVSDVNSGNGWFAVSRTGSADFLKKTDDCLKNINKVNPLFSSNADFSALLNLKSCGFNQYSTFTSQGFPISISYPDGHINIGLLKVLVVEAG